MQRGDRAGQRPRFGGFAANDDAGGAKNLAKWLLRFVETTL